VIHIKNGLLSVGHTQPVNGGYLVATWDNVEDI